MKLSFSKLTVVVTYVIFIFTLIFGFILANNERDTTFFVAAVGICGTILATNVVFYCRKSQAENIIKLRTQFVSSTSKTQIDTFEGMLKLKKEYQITDEELEELKTHTFLDEFTDNAILSTDSKLDTLEDSAETEIEIQGGN